MANLYLDRGALDSAQLALDEARQLYADHDLQLGQTDIDLQSARLALAREDVAGARRWIEAGLDRSLRLDIASSQLEGLELLAELELAVGDHVAASRCLAAADRFRRESGQPPTGVQADRLADLRARLSEDVGETEAPSLAAAVRGALGIDA
jgi:hypothetical protein